MDEIKETHRRVTLRFGEPVERPPALVGARSYAGHGVEWTYICNGESPQLRRAAEAIGATVVDDTALSLDEIFVSHVATEPSIPARS
jgi:ABC-2 type transport system ATP-binding protein